MAPAPKPTPRRFRFADDLLSHRPVHVVWELTLACNLRCKHCGSRAGRARRDELSTDECLDVIGQLADLGTREISLIGGETYLRRDWLTIIKAISDAGIHCGLQTGGRALTEEKIQQAVDAGLRTIGVSIDGPQEIHDWLRGVPGSYERAIQAIRFAVRANLQPGVNTQINALSKPYLRDIFEPITEAGARFWQVQLTVPMGNAADNADILLQPHDIVETIDVLADLFERGRRVGIRLLPGNNVGYFGEHEHMWRTLTTVPGYWHGCSAGETTLGLEADGTIKGCPSLPAERYSGGTTRDVSLVQAIDALVPKTVRHDGARGRGFCASCYYWNVCHGGCTWMADALTRKRGDNPYCYYRARELEKKGLRERVVKIDEAPGLPFDTAQFEIVLENQMGVPMPKNLARDDKKRPRGHKLHLCQNCHEYFLAGERRCPHCQATNSASKQVGMDDGNSIRHIVDQIERETQAICEIINRTRIECG
jgi:radical SAM protein with 4Fe4S-binding SPASM domain